MKRTLTYAEQVEKLKSKGLEIADEDMCLEFLRSVNYYWFSTYFLQFKQTDGTYEPGTSFESVYRIFKFDRKLRTVIFAVIEEIELLLRSQLAYHSAHTYGIHGYLDEANYIKRHDHKRFIKTINRGFHQT
jgi:abortive infection bacteriophage resistance protein